MAIAQNFPKIRPSLNLSFALTKALDPRITFARASAATYYGTETAKAEENLLRFSQELNQVGTWPTINATFTANTEVAPDGTTTAETFTDNATSGAHICSQIIVIPVNTPFTFSCFLKEGTNTHAYIAIRDAAVDERYFAADFNLDTGTVRTTANGTSGTLTSSSITSVGNDWYRCVITGQVAAAGTMRAVIGVSDGTTAFNAFGAIPYVGTGTTIFAWGAQLEQRDSATNYTSTTTQPITNFVPVLESAVAGEARFDHNPVTGESLGLLIEESRTNLILRSEEFDNASWTKARSSIEANTVVAPDGTLTGAKLVENTETNSHALVQNLPAVAKNTTTVFSIYLKPAGRTNVRLQINAFSGNTIIAAFNLSDGTLIVASSSGNGSGATGSIVSVGNGWYRCAIAGIPSATVANGVDATLFTLDSSNSLIYTGDGFSGIFIWGASLEQGAFPTSYISTTTAQVTRAADAASMTGANFTSFFNPSEGTVYFESQTAQGNNAYTYSLFGTNTTNRIFANYGINARIDSGVRVNGTFEVLVATPNNTAPFNTFGKGATAYKFNDFGFSWDGAAALTDTSTTLPTVLELDIGNNGGLANNFLNGHIRKIAYYPKRIANDQLQGLTT